MRKVFPVLFLLLGLGLGFVVFRGAAGQVDGVPEEPVRPQAPLGSDFTYQGRLDIDSAPAEGSYDFRFRLFDASTGGNQVGNTVTVGDVAVSGGFFTVQLDFGAAAFNGQARWLEVAVRDGASDGAYSPLAARQPLTPAPYALHADEAGSVAWAGVQDRPAGLDDGDDDTTYAAGPGLALAGTAFSAEGSPFANVLVVAQSGGDFSSVQAALDSIDDAGPSNPYLVFVAPGVYTETVFLKPYVALEGAGQARTLISGSGGSEWPGNSNDSATLVGADNAAVRHLTVETVGTGQSYAVAIRNYNVSPVMTNVTAIARGASINYGVYNAVSSARMSNVTASVPDGVNHNYAVYNSASSTTMNDVTATASGANYNYGVRNSSSSPTMTNVTATGSGGTYSYGVYNTSSSSPIMTNVTATGLDAGTTSFGVYNGDSSPVMSKVIATASGGSNNFATVNSNASPTIRDSVLSGASGTVEVASGSVVYVANSQIIGPIDPGVICFNNYDENLGPVICPP